MAGILGSALRGVRPRAGRGAAAASPQVHTDPATGRHFIVSPSGQASFIDGVATPRAPVVTPLETRSGRFFTPTGGTPRLPPNAGLLTGPAPSTLAPRSGFDPFAQGSRIDPALAGAQAQAARTPLQQAAEAANLQTRGPLSTSRELALRPGSNGAVPPAGAQPGFDFFGEGRLGFDGAGTPTRPPVTPASGRGVRNAALAVGAGAGLATFIPGDTTDTGEAISKDAQAVLDASDILAAQSVPGDFSSDQKQVQARDKVTQDIRDTVPKKDLPWFDKFAQEFDLLTIGMALLASNDGSKPFAANVGNAMMAGRAAAHSKKRAGTTQLEKEASAERQGRLDALEERRVDLLEREIDIKAITASSKALKEESKLNGINLGSPTNTQLSEVATLFEQLTGVPLRFGKDAQANEKKGAIQIAQKLKLEAIKAKNAGAVLTGEQRKNIVQNEALKMIREKEGFFNTLGGFAEGNELIPTEPITPGSAPVSTGIPELAAPSAPLDRLAALQAEQLALEAQE